MGCDRLYFKLMYYEYCFNPRTHMGCDAGLNPDLAFNGVSIHAPTWGATRKTERSNGSLRSFNPRTHMGCDIKKGVYGYRELVSIHAPTWGATVRINRSFSVRLFQSTHPHGVRPLLITENGLPIKFQSTHPHGVRLRVVMNNILHRSFNPRTHVGCDRPRCPARTAFPGFNPRTHVGCDRTHPWPSSMRQVSIHAPTWGATQDYVKLTKSLRVSIHAPTWGATNAGSLMPSRQEFQSTHPRGVRHIATFLH